MGAEIIITWYNGKPVGLWYDDAMIWETKEVINETDLVSTIVVLPLAEAVSFLTIFINGIASANLIQLLVAINAKIIELKELEANNNNKKDDGWFSNHLDDNDINDIFDYDGG